ncbi:MAG: InlB B-repeat-containing protein [Clostridiales bacterium]|nr:InlB B-repeat-containing protein [Clostridiales bacterium]
MKKKALLVFLLAAASTASVAAFGCNPVDSGDDHTHSYSWHSDAEGHWEECVDGDDSKTKEAHIDEVNNDTNTDGADGKCDVCGRENYTVTFDVQGHGTAPASQTVYKDGKVTNPGLITETGLVFSGWYADAACTTEFDFDGTTVSAPLTVYAKWSVTVTFDTKGHGTAPEAQTVKLGGQVVEPVEPDYGEDGYVFGGWCLTPDGTDTYDFTTPVTEAMTLYAIWTVDTRPLVTFDLGTEGDNATYATQRVEEGGHATKPATDPEIDGYFFAGWYADGSDTEFDFENTAINADTKIVAHWTVDERIMFKFDMQGHGEQIPTQKLEEGQKPTKPADPSADGYTFAGWYATVECDGEEYNFDADVTQNTTVYAKWTITVTFDVQGHGTAPEEQTVKAGGLVTNPGNLNDEPEYKFGGWYKDADCSEEFDFATDTVDADTTIYAKWTHVHPELVLRDEVKVVIGDRTEVQFRYTATEDGRYKLELAQGISENKCSFTTDLAEDEGVRYGANCASSSKLFDLHKGETIVVTLYRGDGIEDDAQLGMYLTPVTDEALPAEGWLSGRYTDSNEYVFDFDREQKGITYAGYGYTAYYIGGSFNYLYFENEQQVGSSADNQRTKYTRYKFTETQPGEWKLEIYIYYSNDPTLSKIDTSTLKYKEPQRAVDLAEFAGTYENFSGKGVSTLDGGIVTKVIIHGNGNGSITSDKNSTFKFTLDGGTNAFDSHNSTLIWNNYNITVNLGDDDTVVSITIQNSNGRNTQNNKSVAIAEYTRTGDAPLEVPEFIPVDSLVNYVGEHFLYYFNGNYASVFYDLDSAFIEIKDAESAGVYIGSYSQYGTAHDIKIEVLGKTGNYTIKMYENTGSKDEPVYELFDTLKPLVENDIPADGAEHTLNASDFVLGRYYYMKAKKSASYNITFTGVDNIILKTDAISGSIIYFEGEDKFSGDKVKIKANTLVAIDIGQVWGPKPESITVKFEELPPVEGESEDSPKEVGLDGWTFSSNNGEVYYAKFIVPSSGTYKIRFYIPDVLGNNYSNGFFITSSNHNHLGYGYADGLDCLYEGQVDEDYKIVNGTPATVTFTEGDTVIIELVCGGWGQNDFKLEIIKA